MAKQKQHTTAEHEDEEGAPARPPRFIFKKYNAVVQSAELVDIRLVSSNFEVKTEYFLHKRAEKSENKSIMKLGVQGVLLEARYDKEEGLVIGDFEWSAWSGKGRSRLLSIKSKYLIVYQTAKDLEDSYVEAFLANVGRFATFPYFRSLVAEYSAASAAELPILPILKQPIVREAEDEKGSEP